MSGNATACPFVSRSGHLHNLTERQLFIRNSKNPLLVFLPLLLCKLASLYLTDPLDLLRFSYTCSKLLSITATISLLSTSASTTRVMWSNISPPVYYIDRDPCTAIAASMIRCPKFVASKGNGGDSRSHNYEGLFYNLPYLTHSIARCNSNVWEKNKKGDPESSLCVTT